MVLLAAVAMQTSRVPHPTPPSPPSSSSPTSPVGRSIDGYDNFYVPAFSQDHPVFSRGYSHAKHTSRRNSTGPLIGTSGITSQMRSPVTSPVHSSLTNLDVWSPNTVSIDTLLRHSMPSNAHSKSGITNGFVHVSDRHAYTSDRSVRSSQSENGNTGDGETAWNHYRAHSGYASGVPDYEDMPKSRSLRRTMSADPRYPHNTGRYCFKPQGSTSHKDPSIPRVCSDGDLLETEHESLDSGYMVPQGTRESRKDTMHRRYSETTWNSSRDSRMNTAYHNPATTRESRKDTMHRKYSDTTPLYTNPLHTSASFSDFGIYKRHYSDESDNCYDSSYSSGYSSSGSVSARNGSGSTGSLQRSGTVAADRAIMGRALSAERTFQMSPMERARGPSRKKSSQTLQTVAENMVQGIKPTKSILKNGNNNNRMSGAGNGGPTPRSASSSRRSSLTSHGGGNLSSDNLDSIEDNEDSCARVSDHPLPTPSSYTRGRQTKKQEPLTRGASSRDKARRSSHPRFKHRSKSLSDLRRDTNDVSSQQTGGRYSDDEDGDDFGFLSHPVHAATVSVSASSAVTSRASSSSSSSSTPSTSSSQRLLPRRWRNKGKNSSSSSGSSQQAMWNPEGPCTWCCVSGRRVVLKPVSILHLSEAERLALQKLASSKLQTMDLGCPIIVPKDNIGEWGRQRKRALSLKRKCKSANLGSLLDTLASSDKGKDKDNKDSKPGLAFGIPLSRVILNDRQRPKKREETPANPGHKRSGSADLLLSPTHDRKSSSSSQGSLENGAPNGTAGTGGNFSESARRVASADSLSTWEESIESNLIEALSLAPGGDSGQSQLLGDGPQVPRVVTSCLQHLENHGLNVVGIFRVGSSKKRVKQLREEFDSGQGVELTEEQNVHDVGALLKEFFRDLPEPLLTRDLFLPFVATRKIKEREKQAEAMRLLLTLLPVANRDTLWALLRFLETVHNHSEDRTDDSGQELAGNKMDSQNLATLFGPNLLHCLRAVNEKQLLAECAEQAEQSSEVIGVIKDLIDNRTELFEISESQHDEVLKLMMEADRENLEIALRRLSAEHEAETEPDTSTTTTTTDTTSTGESLPHSANSDADLLSLVRRKGSNQHQPLRLSRSADPWTDGPHSSQDPSTTDGRGPPGEDTASEPCPSPRRRRPVSSSVVTGTRPSVVTSSAQDATDSPRVTVTQRRRSRGNTDSQPLVRQGAVRERPYSDTYSGRLAPPRPSYSRENSGGTSSDGSSGQASSPGPTTPTTTTTTTGDSTQREGGYSSTHQLPALRQYPSASRYRPGTISARRQEEGEEGEKDGAKWQRERWRHWQQVSAERQVPDAEQETLV